MNHAPRRWLLTMGIVVLLVAFAALAYVGSRRASHAGQQATTHTTTHQSAPAGKDASKGTGATSTTAAGGAGGRGAKRSTTTTTTAPLAIVATTSADTSATYTAPAGSYQVLLSASQPCWVLATDTGTGHVVWTGTLQAGQDQDITGDGALAVELGAPGTTMTLNGVPVVLPSTAHVPFTATFQPAPPAATGAGATTTTTP